MLTIYSFTSSALRPHSESGVLDICQQFPDVALVYFVSVVDDRMTGNHSAIFCEKAKDKGPSRTQIQHRRHYKNKQRGLGCFQGSFQNRTLHRCTAKKIGARTSDLPSSYVLKFDVLEPPHHDLAISIHGWELTRHPSYHSCGI
jgi:hypothetical protein